MQIILTVFPLFSHQYPPWALMKTKKFFSRKNPEQPGLFPGCSGRFSYFSDSTDRDQASVPLLFLSSNWKQSL